MFSVYCPGPLEEKYATVGAGLYRGTSRVGRMVAVGFLYRDREESKSIYEVLGQVS
jgi:hypothetical protein